jgi:hypothetical protein
MADVIKRPTLSLARTKELVRANIRWIMSGQAREPITLYLVGDPGSGKTSAVRQVAQEEGLGYDDMIVAQWDPGELGGFPKMDPNRDDVPRARPSWMPPLDSDWNVFLLDELPQAQLSQLNIAAQLIQERRVGRHHLPEKTILIATGNPQENRAGTTKMPSHLRDRLTYVYVKTDAKQWCQWAAAEGYHPAVIGYIKSQPDNLTEFDAAAEVANTARSWSKVDETVRMFGCDPDSDLMFAQINGSVNCATDVVTYIRLWKTLPPIELILSDPMGAPLPPKDQVHLAYSLSGSIATAMDVNNFDACLAYLNRLGSRELTGFAIFAGKERNKQLNSHPSVVKWISTDGQKLLR